MVHKDQDPLGTKQRLISRYFFRTRLGAPRRTLTVPLIWCWHPKSNLNRFWHCQWDCRCFCPCLLFQIGAQDLNHCTKLSPLFLPPSPTCACTCTCTHTNTVCVCTICEKQQGRALFRMAFELFSGNCTCTCVHVHVAFLHPLSGKI